MPVILDRYSPRKSVYDADRNYAPTGNVRNVNEGYERPKNWDLSSERGDYIRPSVETQGRGINQELMRQYQLTDDYNHPNELIPALGRINHEITSLMNNMQRQTDVPVVSSPPKSYVPMVNYGRHDSWARTDPYVMRQQAHDNGKMPRWES